MASLSVNGKYALITGAGSGISLAFAKLLLSRGCSVLIGDFNLRPEAQQLLSEYPHPPPSGNPSPSALFQKADVTSWPQLTALFNKALAEFPQLDIVCPGAGLFEPAFSNFWQPPRTESNPDSPSTDDAAAEPGTYKILDVNLTHPIRLSQLAVAHWTGRRIPGCLVHVSSVAGHAASIGTPLYYASKHGLHGFVRALGGLRDVVGIRVGAVAPGAVKTPIWSDNAYIAAATRGGEDAPMSPDEIAWGMLELCENPSYGDGTILEVTIDATRVVPLYHADPPTGEGIMLDGYRDAEVRIVEDLKTKGLRS